MRGIERPFAMPRQHRLGKRRCVLFAVRPAVKGPASHRRSSRAIAAAGDLCGRATAAHAAVRSGALRVACWLPLAQPRRLRGAAPHRGCVPSLAAAGQTRRHALVAQPGRHPRHAEGSLAALQKPPASRSRLARRRMTTTTRPAACRTASRGVHALVRRATACGVRFHGCCFTVVARRLRRRAHAAWRCCGARRARAGGSPRAWCAPGVLRLRLRATAAIKRPDGDVQAVSRARPVRISRAAAHAFAPGHGAAHAACSANRGARPALCYDALTLWLWPWQTRVKPQAGKARTTIRLRAGAAGTLVAHGLTRGPLRAGFRGARRGRGAF